MDRIRTPLGCDITLDRPDGYATHLPPIRLLLAMPRDDGRFAEVLLSEENLVDLLAAAAQVLNDGGD
jgi:hypothetical protein